MSEWPKDWPEEAKTGENFLRELFKRFPDKVIVAPIEKIADEFFKPDEPESNN